MNRTTKRLIFAAGGVGAVALVVLALRPSPLVVEVSRATRADLQVSVDEEGETRIRDRYLVTAPVPGRVQRIPYEPGDTIARGQVMARLTPLPLDPRGRAQAEARLEAAADAQRATEATLARARAALAQAQRARGRAAQLADSGLLAPEERERAELEATSRAREVESADFQAQAAAHDVELARAALRGDSAVLAIRAPIAGRVLRNPEKSARVVAAGEVLLELGDPSQLDVVVDLLSEDAVNVRAGDAVLIEQWGGDHPLRARVRSVAPAAFTKVSALGVEEQRVQVTADLLDAAGPLGDGYRVEARVVRWQGHAVLTVPASALFRQGEGWAVFVARAGRARLQAVTVGHRNPFAAEILEGLAEGDAVLRHPSDQVTDGARVRARLERAR